ncbi:MAG: phasin family protein [Gloeomargarita sp. SKYG116]|nr:phasin family protein [Gloeomargarita sp. SKYG116]MCS7226609.1 phasin family protein [Gloeomargarita sp. SKYB31]MDW8401656.1 phasin family protein [Gloeomargarita sp. SKYGB_i_bin116]
MEQDNLLRQLLLLGIGATSLVVDKVREVSDEWVQNGRLRPDQATAFINELVGRLTQGTDWENRLRRQMRDTLRELGIASQSEVDELRGRIDRLERQVRDLENRLWR